MDRRDEPDHGGATQRERVSRLGAAILRIVVSLDVDTVLREVVDSARDLKAPLGYEDFPACVRALGYAPTGNAAPP